jgi:hypothetical protein
MTFGDSMLIAAGTGIAFIGLCSVPALGTVATRLGKRDARQDAYEDADGKASPESVRAYSAALPKSVVLASGAAGLGVSIVLLVISPHAEGLLVDSLSTASWVSAFGRALPFLPGMTTETLTRASRPFCCSRLWP